MAITKRPNKVKLQISGKLSILAATFVPLIINSSVIRAELPTRDQNPITQMFYLPSYIATLKNGNSAFSAGLLITNTYQNKSSGNEQLIIDTENYRLDIGWNKRFDDWLISVNLPFYSNQSGSLDTTIEDWHDFFGFPQGGRDKVSNDQLDIHYQIDSNTIFRLNQPTDGVGDIPITLSRQFFNDDGAVNIVSLTLEIPTGNLDEATGNEANDWAVSASGYRNITNSLKLTSLLGMSFPGKKGALKNHIASHIFIVQVGLKYDFNSYYSGIAQLDYHSAYLKSSDLRAFSNSLQVQLGLRLNKLFNDKNLDLFFSEDILVGSAPDITFGIRLSSEF